MKDKASMPPPNYTAVPNLFLDEVLSQIESMSELKVTLAIMRKTFGWQKKSDTISIGQLITATGLSEQSVRNGLTAGMKRGTIVRIPDGQTFNYTLNIKPEEVQDLDPPKTCTPLNLRPEPPQDLGGLGVQDLDPQKKEEKEKKETNSAPQRGRRNGRGDSKPPDPRSSHPAIQAMRQVLGHYPNKLVYDGLIELLGPAPDIPKLTTCATTWAKRGNNVHNTTVWLYDWYLNGIPDSNGRKESAYESASERNVRLIRESLGDEENHNPVAPRKLGPGAGAGRTQPRGGGLARGS